MRIDELQGFLEPQDGNILESYRGTYRVIAASLGDDASVLGAAAWAETEIAGDSKPTQAPGRPTVA